MKVRIITHHGYLLPQFKGVFGWEDIRLRGNRLFDTEKEAIEAINAKLYPEGRVLYEGEVS